MLYLFLKLREDAIDRAGYVSHETLINLSHRNRYVNLPELRKLGWINADNKLKSVYKIISEAFPHDECNNTHITIDLKYLKNKKSLKSLIFAITEQYILKGKFRSEVRGIPIYDRESKRYKRERLKRANGSGFETIINKYQAKDSTFNEYIHKNPVLNNDSEFTSRISHSMLEEWDYDSRSISRFRKEGINTYKEREYVIVDEDTDSSYLKHLKQSVKYLPIEVTAKANHFFRRDTNSPSIYNRAIYSNRGIQLKGTLVLNSMNSINISPY